MVATGSIGFHLLAAERTAIRLSGSALRRDYRACVKPEYRLAHACDGYALVKYEFAVFMPEARKKRRALPGAFNVSWFDTSVGALFVPETLARLVEQPSTASKADSRFMRAAFAMRPRAGWPVA